MKALCKVKKSKQQQIDPKRFYTYKCKKCDRVSDEKKQLCKAQNNKKTKKGK